MNAVKTGGMDLSEITDSFQRGSNALSTAEKFIELDLFVAANRIYPNKSGLFDIEEKT